MPSNLRELVEKKVQKLGLKVDIDEVLQNLKSVGTMSKVVGARRYHIRKIPFLSKNKVTGKKEVLYIIDADTITSPRPSDETREKLEKEYKKAVHGHVH